MDKLKLLYKNEDGVCIVKVSDKKYYYGDGKTFGGFGVSPNQFLRFNPNMEYVEDKEEKIPEQAIDWIEKHS